MVTLLGDLSRNFALARTAPQESGLAERGGNGSIDATGNAILLGDPGIGPMSGHSSEEDVWR